MGAHGNRRISKIVPEPEAALPGEKCDKLRHTTKRLAAGVSVQDCRGAWMPDVKLTGTYSQRVLDGHTGSKARSQKNAGNTVHS